MGARAVLDKLVEAGEQQVGPAPRRAVALPPLRPYLPSRRHLRRIVGGLVVLVRMVPKAARTGLALATAPPKTKQDRGKAETPPAAQGSARKDGQKPSAADTLDRAGAAVLASVIAAAAVVGVVHTLWSQVRPYASVVGAVTTAAVLTAAWIVGPNAGEQSAEDPAVGGEATPEPASLPQAPPLDAETIAATVRRIAAPRGWKGAHLDDVLAHLPGRSREELLAALAEAGIPVTEQLKLTLPGGRQRNRQGVRLSALPAAPAGPGQPAVPGPPEPPAEAAPEPALPAATVTVYGAE